MLWAYFTSPPPNFLVHSEQLKFSLNLFPLLVHIRINFPFTPGLCTFLTLQYDDTVTRSMRKNLRKVVHKTLLRMGYEAAKPTSSLLDLRTTCTHPAEIQYFTTLNPILMDVTIKDGRGLRVLPLTEVHPFVFAIKNARHSIGRLDSILASLRHYYSKVQPASAAEWLHLSQPEQSPLHRLPPWALSMPWDRRTPIVWQRAREQFALEENLALGKKMTIEDGWHFWGPVSDEKLYIESQRLCNLLASYESRGYYRHNGHDGDIRAVVLQNGKSWCWQVAGGEHRAALMAALDYSHIPVRVLQVVRRDDVDFWPGVVNFTYTRQAALEAFDLIFSGDSPSIAKNWHVGLS